MPYDRSRHTLHRHHELADPVDTEHLQQRTEHEGCQHRDFADVLTAQATTPPLVPSPLPAYHIPVLHIEHAASIYRTN
jgi:hypothetical protein